MEYLVWEINWKRIFLRRQKIDGRIKSRMVRREIRSVYLPLRSFFLTARQLLRFPLSLSLPILLFCLLDTPSWIFLLIIFLLLALTSHHHSTPVISHHHSTPGISHHHSIPIISHHHSTPIISHHHSAPVISPHYSIPIISHALHQ